LVVSDEGKVVVGAGKTAGGITSVGLWQAAKKRMKPIRQMRFFMV
jgi:hypothetical protein